MGNFRKSFNFRSGLQVDQDNFVVSDNGAVGIGTSIPVGYALDVRGDIGATGLVTSTNLYASNTASVGFLTASNAYAGIITVGQLKVGTSEVVDNLIGYARTTFVTDAGPGLSTTSQIGIGTISDANYQLTVNGDTNVDGTLTATTFSGSGASLNNIPNSATTATNANTASAIVARDTSGNFSAGTITASLTGTASLAQGLTGSPNITVNSVETTDVKASGIVTAITELNVGTDGTAVTALNTGRLGIGTAIPSSEIQIRKASGSLLEVISDSGQARISIGNSVGVGNSSALLRFGNSSNDFDIINYDVGDIKTTIHGGTGAGSTGNFKWVYGQNNAERMTLTYDGKLGINQSTPVNTLHVVGTSTVTGNAWVGGNLNVAGNITGNLTFPSIITGTNLSNISGITTLNDLKVSNSIDFSTISVVALGNTVAVGTDFAAPDPSDGIPFGLTVNNKLKANRIAVQDGIDMSAGIMTASKVRSTFGFRSGVGAEFIQIDYASSPDRIVFTVAGIGLTSLNLY